MSEHDDRGAATILVVLMMPLLVFFGALVFDGGRGILARRQTQNAADAGALAKATDCAKGIGSTNLVPYETNGAVLANAPSCGSGVTTVTMQRTVNFLFRPDLPGGSADVTRSATARWGTLGSATTAPVVISQCSFNIATSDGAVLPSEEVIIPLGGGGPECPDSDVPGAFGWLDTGLSAACSITTTLNSSGQLLAHGNTGTGNGDWWGCITQAGVNGFIMVPIFGAACFNPSPCVEGQNDGAGNNNYYLIVGFAQIQLTGWNLQHGSPTTNPTGTVPSCPGPGSASCLRGRFVEFATQQGSTGPGTNFGVMKVFLSLS